MSDRLAIWPQYVMPQRALTVWAGKLANGHYGRWTHAFINRFVARYKVDMSQAAEPDTAAYPSFNAFFTRPLKPGARPIAERAFVSPVDGAISQCGAIERDQIFQAKGHHYSSRALVGGDAALSALFDHGQFATLYLSPRDYHRIHMPCEGRLLRMIYVPGDLFSVNPATARAVPGLFARNERVVCVFEGAHGPFVLTLVGATIVGSMQTVWHGVVNPQRTGVVQEWRYDTQNIVLAQGEEMGRFMLGSTVVMLFPRGVMQFESDWLPARPILMGEAMGSLVA